ncbi:MAG: hypothetical protein V1824_03175 [archaeon]
MLSKATGHIPTSPITLKKNRDFRIYKKDNTGKFVRDEKQIVDPFEKFKFKKDSNGKLIEDKRTIEYINKILSIYYHNPYSKEGIEGLTLVDKLKTSILAFEKQIKEINSKEYKTGKGIHILLPLGGMSTYGHFFRGYFEKNYPDCKISFLHTPKKYLLNNVNRSFNRDFKYKEELNSIIKKLVDVKKDSCFFVFDFISGRTTVNAINIILEDIYGNKQFKYYTIDSPETADSNMLRNYLKGKSFLGMNASDIYKGILMREGIFEDRYENGQIRKEAISLINNLLWPDADLRSVIDKDTFNEANKKRYFELKREEIIKANVFYYLGRVFDLNKSPQISYNPSKKEMPEKFR